MDSKAILSRVLGKQQYNLMALAFGFGWIEYNCALVLDSIEESELYWVFVSKQVDSVAIEVVGRWKLEMNEEVDEPVKYAIQEDFEEELLERMSYVYPPVSIMREIETELLKAKHISDGTSNRS